jgi:hypothetical protein
MSPGLVETLDEINAKLTLEDSKNKANTLLHFETLKRNLAHPRAACVYSCASDDPIDDCSYSRHVVIVNADSYSTHYTSIIHWCIV